MKTESELHKMNYDELHEYVDKLIEAREKLLKSVEQIENEIEMASHATGSI
jgi:cell division septum initiation protein DivIVA